MDIIITAATGTGNTELSAFDNALWNAGVANYNLIKLSSIIPPGSRIVIKKPDLKPEEYGQRLYVVLSEQRVSKRGQVACAGVGWYLLEDGRGVFVEHHGTSVKKVEKQLIKSLQDLARQRGVKGVQFHTKTSSIKCKDKPVCALVCAIYKSEPW
ncbi:MAG: pyruvoyl-dependent arginine decarboxylase [Candidatus Diapherotrites archaeon]